METMQLTIRTDLSTLPAAIEFNYAALESTGVAFEKVGGDGA